MRPPPREEGRIIIRVVDKRQARQALQDDSTQFAKYAVRLSRKDLKILIGLLTGHNTLNRHLTLLKLEEDPTCPLFGEEYDTSLHLLEDAVLSLRNEENSLYPEYIQNFFYRMNQIQETAWTPNNDFFYREH